MIEQKLDIEIFKPSIVELKTLVEKSKNFVVVDYKDVKKLSLIKESRIELKNTRVKISKLGKELRQSALDFQRKVIAREKELLEIIEPEEKRLEYLENEAIEKQEQERRWELIPRRNSILDNIGDKIKISDEELVKMDDKGFDIYLQQRRIDKLERDRLLLEEEKKKIEEEKQKIALEKEMKIREEKIREEEQKKLKLNQQKHEQENKERLEKEEKERKERIFREEQESKERILKQEQEAKDKLKREEEERQAEKKRLEQQKFEEQKRIREEKERLEKEEKFQEFLKINGYDEKRKGEYIIENYPDVVYLFKKIATFQR